MTGGSHCGQVEDLAVFARRARPAPVRAGRPVFRRRQLLALGVRDLREVSDPHLAAVHQTRLQGVLVPADARVALVELVQAKPLRLRTQVKLPRDPGPRQRVDVRAVEQVAGSSALVSGQLGDCVLDLLSRGLLPGLPPLTLGHRGRAFDLGPKGRSSSTIDSNSPCRRSSFASIRRRPIRKIPSTVSRYAPRIASG